MRRYAAGMILAALTGGWARGETLAQGQIIDEVQCAADASQHYALYLPSNFTPLRKWPVILAYDAGGRGRRGVERYIDAAEKYGYIVAGSNNSRNGPWDVSLQAAQAMTADVEKRFTIDPKRVYTAGMSGGARVAMKLAMDSGTIAGVFASSAGVSRRSARVGPLPHLRQRWNRRLQSSGDARDTLDRDLKSPQSRGDSLTAATPGCRSNSPPTASSGWSCRP